MKIESDLSVRECRNLIEQFFRDMSVNPVKANPKSWRFGLACFERGFELGKNSCFRESLEPIERKSGKNL